MALAGTPTATSRNELDSALGRVRDAASRFTRLSIGDRTVLARSILDGYARIAERSVAAACAAKRIPMGTPAEGEEWIGGPFITMLHLRQWISALEALQRKGSTPIGTVAETIDGRRSIRTFPSARMDGLLFRGVVGEVHLQPGISEKGRAAFYRDRQHSGRVTLVLGGGNVNSIPPLDVATKMFNEGSVCLLKMNPVNAYLGPLLEEAFAAPIRSGFLSIVYGGADEGSYLAQHQDVDEVLITGSDRTHDLLVWGPPGPERAARMAENRPLLAKPITAELGNVTPVIVVPGPYSDRQLAWQAANIAGGVTNNASFNCNANKLLISARDWPQRSSLLDHLERVFSGVPVRAAYYPGARDRYQRLTEGRTGARRIGKDTDGSLPWTLLTDLDPENRQETAYRTEPFCSVISEMSLDSREPIDFLQRAVQFANDRLWGTLSATIVVHPSTLSQSGVAEAVERAIVELRYGTVGVNIWSAFGFAIGTPWGGHPSSSPQDIQSGSGFVHNTAMLEGVEKTVVRHPLTVFPKPLHFPGHRTAHEVGRRLVALEASGSWLQLPAVVAAAARG